MNAHLVAYRSIYFNPQHNGPEPTIHYMTSDVLPAAVSACLLHTGFEGGAHFLRTWAAWRADPQRPRMLHYVALAAQVRD